MTMSLETKLVVSSIALLATVCAVIATATTLLFHDFLTDRLDRQVTSAVRRSTSAAAQRDDPPPEAREVSFLLSPGQAEGTFGARIRQGVVRRAAVLTGISTVRELPAPPSLATVSRAPVTVDLGPLGDYRMAAARTPDGDVLVTGLPMTAVDSMLTRLVVVEAAVTLAGVALTAAAGTLLVRRAVRQLGRQRAGEHGVHAQPAAGPDPEVVFCAELSRPFRGLSVTGRPPVLPFSGSCRVK
ncbi:hypothetical protein [Nonomuraea jabiensis]|uniref:hypothetical protein n=1 Tax=Nonomuraea jabiensis TaxID=882448 RepID=UPI003696F861